VYRGVLGPFGFADKVGLRKWTTCWRDWTHAQDDDAGSSSSQPIQRPPASSRLPGTAASEAVGMAYVRALSRISRDRRQEPKHLTAAPQVDAHRSIIHLTISSMRHVTRHVRTRLHTQSLTSANIRVRIENLRNQSTIQIK